MTRRTKALQISKKVKERVHARDNKCCVWCGKIGIPNAHFIPRSKGGLGIEENILTLCTGCHNEFDNGNKGLRQEMKAHFKKYLKGKYTNWKEEDLYYRKEI